MLRYLVIIFTYIQQYLHRLAKPRHSRPIRIVCVADTHSQQLPVPRGDVLIHAGDLTRSGKLSELRDAIAWLNSQPHAYKIVIAGNADLPLDPKIKAASAANVEWGDIIYLCGRVTTLKLAASGRELTIYGDPHVPRCGADGEEAFQYEVDDDYWRDRIPSEADIVVTHTPPRYILDEWDASAQGCASLLREIERVRPALHVFGHVHPAYGQEIVMWENMPYESHALRRVAHELQGRTVGLAVGATLRVLAAIVMTGLHLFRYIIFGGSNIESQTTFINAAAMAPDGIHLKNSAAVVDM